MEDNGTTTLIGRRVVDRVPFGIRPDDRFRHLHIIGQTGTGKSHLLKQLFLQDAHAGNGCAFIDPHGVEAVELLDYIPLHRMRDVVYFNATDRTHPLGFNLLGNVPRDDRDRVAQEVVGTFRYLWADTWGRGRMQYIFRNTVAALLDFPKSPGATLLGVARMYSDRDYRDRVIRHIRNPSVRHFWTAEFPEYTKRFAAEALSPIQNKVGQFLLSDTLRNTLGQVRSTIDLSYIMDNRRILIANLDKGKLGDDDANILGSLLVTGLYLAARRRSSIPEEERVPFHLYLDEFHSFATDAFISVLSEARKYRLSLTTAHQFLDQVPEAVLAAVLGNVGTLVAFRLGADDAKRIAPHFDPYSALALGDLANFEIIARVLENGLPVATIGRTDPLTHPRYDRSKKLITYSRKRYTRPREDVEAAHIRWLKPPARRRRSRGGGKK